MPNRMQAIFNFSFLNAEFQALSPHLKTDDATMLRLMRAVAHLRGISTFSMQQAETRRNCEEIRIYCHSFNE
jgi:hypothetical protein